MNKSKLYKKAKKYRSNGRSAEAYKYFLEAALTEDDGYAMYELGDMYMDGEYVRCDYAKAGHYFGMAYDKGADIPRFVLIIAANYWELKALEEKNECPEVNVSRNEVFQNAVRFYRIAAERGESFAYDCLGALYFKIAEYEKAFEYLKKTDGKNPQGWYYLGRLYEEGLGVDPDIGKAISSYKKAFKLGQVSETEYYMDDANAINAFHRLEELGVM